MTFTDDFVVSAWVKLSSYVTGTIASRFNGTSGWTLDTIPTGQITLAAFNAGAGNYSQVISYQSIPLNKWVHITVQLDMSTYTATTTTSYIMFDGINVPAYLARGGTNPTALVQAGNLEIGSRNGGTQFFPGKIAQVAIYSAKVTQATILASMNQTLTGSETSLVSAYTFNNSINDLSANANNLTPQGSAVATSADSPMNATEYGIVMANSFSTNTTLTVQVPEGYSLPTSGGIGTVSYSTQKTPYGFPGQRGKWTLEVLNRTLASQTTPTQNVWYNIGSLQISIPAGDWIVGYDADIYGDRASGDINISYTLSNANNTELDRRFTSNLSAANTISLGANQYKAAPLSISSQTVYYGNLTTRALGINQMYILGDRGNNHLFAENAYL